MRQRRIDIDDLRWENPKLERVRIVTEPRHADLINRFVYDLIPPLRGGMSVADTADYLRVRLRAFLREALVTSSSCPRCAEKEQQWEDTRKELQEDLLHLVQRAWPTPHPYFASPLELVTDVINERDGAVVRAKLAEAQSARLTAQAAEDRKAFERVVSERDAALAECQRLEAEHAVLKARTDELLLKQYQVTASRTLRSA